MRTTRRPRTSPKLYRPWKPARPQVARGTCAETSSRRSISPSRASLLEAASILDLYRRPHLMQVAATAAA